MKSYYSIRTTTTIIITSDNVSSPSSSSLFPLVTIISIAVLQRSNSIFIHLIIQNMQTRENEEEAKNKE